MMEPGDILVWKDPADITQPHRWRVIGVHLAAVGRESLIEVESLTHKPGWTGKWESHPRLFLPEVLTRVLICVPS